MKNKKTELCGFLRDVLGNCYIHMIDTMLIYIRVDGYGT